MPSLVTMPLPAGKLGVVFSGTPPCVKRVSEESPMLGKVKEGYICKALKLSDGTTIEGTSTKQLVDALKESADDEGRSFVMEMALPDGTTVDLPAGDLGVVVANVDGKATITNIAADSPLRHSLRVGYVVDSVMLEDGTELHGHDAKEVDILLTADKSSGGRRMSLKNPEKGGLSTRKISLPDEKIINLPTGKLGISFKGSPAEITKISDESPLQGLARVGFMVDSFVLPEGVIYSGYDAIALTKALTAAKDVEGRKLVLKNSNNPTLSTTPQVKVTFPSYGNADDLGLSFQGNAVKTVSSSIKLTNGQIIVQINDNSGKTYDTSTEELLKDAISDCSGCAGRFAVVKEGPPIPLNGEMAGIEEEEET